MSDEINLTPASAEGSSEAKPADAESFGVAKEEITPAEPVEPASVENSSVAKPEPQIEPEATFETPTAQSVQIEPLAEAGGFQEFSRWIAKGREIIAGKKRKKIEKIMTLFEKKTKITNDEVEKLLRVSDATATRYLSILKKEGKIQQVGKTGKSVSYLKL